MIITLDTNKEEDEYPIEMLHNGASYFRVINQMHEYIRAEWKHGDIRSIDIEELWEKWWDILSDNNVEPY